MEKVVFRLATNLNYRSWQELVSIRDKVEAKMAKIADGAIQIRGGMETMQRLSVAHLLADYLMSQKRWPLGNALRQGVVL